MPAQSLQLTRVRGLFAAVLALCASLALLPSIADNVRDWFEPAAHLSHGPLVMATVLWLMWRSGLALSPVTTRGWLIALAAVLALGAVAAAGQLAAIQMITGLVWPAMIALVVWGSLGTAGLLRYLVPIGICYFAMPIRAPIQNFLLWPATVWVAPRLVALLGIPSHAEGNVILMPRGSFEIEDACSGASFVLMGMLIAILFCHLWALDARRALRIVATAVLLAFAANVARIVAIVAIGYESEMRNPLVQEHSFFGWCIFAVTFTFYFWRLRVRLGPPPEPTVAAPASAAALRGPLWRGGALLLAAAALPALAYVLQARADAGLGPIARGVAAALPGMALQAFPAGVVIDPIFPGAPFESRRRVDGSSGTVWVYANAFGPQRRGRELFERDARVLGAAAQVVDSAVIRIADAGSRQQPVLESIVRDAAGGLWLEREARVVGGAVLAAATPARLRMLRYAASARIPVSGVIVTASACEDRDCVGARGRSARAWEVLLGRTRAAYAD